MYSETGGQMNIMGRNALGPIISSDVHFNLLNPYPAYTRAKPPEEFLENILYIYLTSSEKCKTWIISEENRNGRLK